MRIYDMTDFIYTKKNALPHDFCDRLIEVHKTHRGVREGETSTGPDPDKKHSQDLMLDAHPDLEQVRGQLLAYTLEHITDYFVEYPFVGSVMPTLYNQTTDETLELTIDNIGQIPRDVVKSIIPGAFRSGTINVQRYEAGKGGYPHWHSEIFPDEKFEGLHRIALWMYYLNDVTQGGETEFYFQNKSLRPEKGTIVIAPAGFTHTHRGNTPLSNDKYIATSWVLYSRAGQMREGSTSL